MVYRELFFMNYIIEFPILQQRFAAPVLIIGGNAEENVSKNAEERQQRPISLSFILSSSQIFGFGRIYQWKFR